MVCFILNSDFLFTKIAGCVLPFNNIASALLLERNYFMEPPNQCHLQSGGSCQSDGNQPVGCPTSSYYQPPLPYDVTITINGVATYYAQVTGNDIVSLKCQFCAE